jgi:hypothetical protein
MKAITLVLASFVLYSAATAHAQSGLESANGKVGLIEKTGSLGFDLSEAKIGIFYVGSTVLDTTWGQWELSLAGAAKKFRHDFFSKGELNPEFSAGGRYAWFKEKDDSGYSAIYLAAQASIVSADFVTKTGSAITALNTATQSSLLGALGFNKAFTEDVILGLTARGGRQWNATTNTTPEEVCVQTGTGTVDGKPVEAFECKQRLTTSPYDRWVAHARVDFTIKVIRPKAEDLPTIGLLFASSVTGAKRAKPLVALAVGPTLHPPGAPSTFVAGILAEITDVGNTSNKDFDQRFFVRLYAAVPFSMF